MYIEHCRSTAVSVFAVGGAVGGISSGFVADKAGRRGGLLFTNIFAFLASACMGCAKMVGFYPLIIVGRFLIGIYAACHSYSKMFLEGLSVLVPIYLTEVSPTNLRGMIGSLHQLLITISILFSQIVGLPQILGTDDRWPIILALTAIVALLQVITLPMIPESPKWSLAVKGDVDKATADLEKLRGTSDVGAEMDALKDEATGAKAGGRLTFADMFRGSLRWPMTIATMLMLTQQLSGINAAMFYSTYIFKQAGLSDVGAVYATIGMGTVNVLMTIISTWLVSISHKVYRGLTYYFA
ncbi:unnamed protein product [Strongylus vulgaris]|uniref:Major facilitator superfamily (MFS) profile domain-containing protein n=1 Tax=Strongylus vulgaris TaxID=40348 RepID=A0A3P7IJ48_STRVU|nr:unnamed protein product [Strongylus vulgaris]